MGAAGGVVALICFSSYRKYIWFFGGKRLTLRRETEKHHIMIKEILRFNKEFVENKGYEKYLTSKYPDKKLAILTCMDTRLTMLLPAALGLKNGDVKLIKNAGGLVSGPFDSSMRSLLVGVYELGVEEIMVVAHSDCGACHLSGKEMRELMLERGIEEKVIETVERSGTDIVGWLEGFHDTEASVRRSVGLIRNHPLMPKDVRVSGYVIDSETGLLSEIDCREV